MRRPTRRSLRALSLACLLLGCAGGGPPTARPAAWSAGAPVTKENAGAQIPLMTRACDGGAAQACSALGQLYQAGEVTAKDLPLAMKLYTRACKLQPDELCAPLSHAVELALGTDAGGEDDKLEGVSTAKLCWMRDTGCRAGDDSACELLASGCDDGYPSAGENYSSWASAAEACRSSGESCAIAGQLREGASGVAASLKEAEALYAKGCQTGDRTSCVRQAKLYESRKLSGDPGKVLDEACGRGIAGICMAAGRAYRQGAFGKREPGRALESFSRACAQAEPEGCLELARGQRDRIAGPAAPGSAVEAFRKACAMGHLVACGEGKQVEPSATAWFEAQACFHDEAASCLKIAGGPAAGPSILVSGAPSSAAARFSTGCGQFQRCGLQFVGPRDELLLSSAGRLTLWDPTSGAVAAHVSLSSLRKNGPKPGFGGWPLQRTIGASSWGWDEAAGSLVGLVAIGGYGQGVERGVATWSPAREPLPRLLRASLPDEEIVALAMSADLRFALIGFRSARSGALLFDLRTRRPIGAPIPISNVSTIAFGPDGSLVAIGSAEGKLALVSTATGAATQLASGSAAISALSFHPTRPVLVVADPATRVRVWQLDALERGPTPLAERGELAAFSPDGRYLALSKNGQLVLLDAATFLRAARPAPCSACYRASSIAFSPDARYAVIAADDGVHSFAIAAQPAAAVAPPAADRAWLTKLRRLPVPAAPPSPPFARDGTVKGHVSMNDKPVAGAEVELKPWWEEWSDARALPRRVTRTAKDGSYVFQRVPEIDWHVTASIPESQRGGGRVSLREKKDGWYAIRLEPGVTLRGKVLDAAGQPVSGARVEISDGERVELTDRAGAFVFRGLAPRGYLRLQARRAAAVGMSYVGATGELRALEVVIHLLAPSDPRLLRIKVVDGGGKPLANAQVLADFYNLGSTDPRGTLTIDAGDQRALSIHVKVEGEDWALQPIELPQPDVVTVTAKPPE